MRDMSIDDFRTKTLVEFNNTEDIVLHLLKTDERCRNDDKWLTYRTIRFFTNIFIPFEDFKRFPSFETVSRARRKVQNQQGLFPPTDQEVIVKRKIRSDTIIHWNRT